MWALAAHISVSSTMRTCGGSSALRPLPAISDASTCQAHEGMARTHARTNDNEEEYTRDAKSQAREWKRCVRSPYAKCGRRSASGPLGVRSSHTFLVQTCGSVKLDSRSLGAWKESWLSALDEVYWLLKELDSELSLGSGLPSDVVDLDVPVPVPWMELQLSSPPRLLGRGGLRRCMRSHSLRAGALIAER